MNAFQPGLIDELITTAPQQQPPQQQQQQQMKDGNNTNQNLLVRQMSELSCFRVFLKSVYEKTC